MFTGIDNNEGDADGWFVQKLFFAKPVVAKIVAMIRREYDHCVFEQTAVLQRRKQNTKLIIKLFN